MQSPAPPSSPYDAYVDFQCSSSELVIYAPSVGQIVTIAWPLNSSSDPITPTGIRHWLRIRGLHWPCFCASTVDTSVSSRIVVYASTSYVYALCHKQQFGCGFEINLTGILASSVLHSAYGHLPTIRSENAPFMADSLANFFLRAPNVTAPYFEGYCSEHCIDYPDVHQLSGDSLCIFPFKRAVSHKPSAAKTTVIRWKRTTFLETRLESVEDLNSASAAATSAQAMSSSAVAA
ncbi:hypothetical protein CPB84DRAFT_1856883 [Gymnopilus junonius]|uniref:Uncharacterized protein n=1 Tax=Gymnopilus junonius TaxID=109634 RepID=A0A9P5TFD3_GYMJU|nr:hypothetical protein CPB84DRAFT_1856883 [Gymnopilus junonius]